MGSQGAVELRQKAMQQRNREQLKASLRFLGLGTPDIERLAQGPDRPRDMRRGPSWPWARSLQESGWARRWTEPHRATLAAWRNDGPE